MAEEKTWTVLESRYLVKDGWIALRADRCLTAEGVEVSPHYVLEYPDWVQIVALNDEGQVLLVRQYRHGAGRYTTELPAGKVDPGETDAVVTARRELLEETGCEARETRVIGVHWANPAIQSNRVHTVLCTGVRQVGEPLDDPHERIEHFWVSAAEAMRMAKTGELSPSIQVASLMLGLLEVGRLNAP